MDARGDTIDAGEGDTVGGLLDSLRRFAAKEIDAKSIDQEGAIPKRVLEGLAELGVFGVSVPEAYGGAGLLLAAACRVVDTLARFDRSVATTVGLHLGLGTRGLIVAGDAALKERYLPEVAAGQRIAAFAATEAGAGSDLSAVVLKAAPDGAEVTVDGTKIFVTNARFAGLLTVLAASPELGGGRRSRSLIVIDPATPGVEIGKEERKMGLRGSSTASIMLEGVRVPRSHALGAGEDGTSLLEGVLAFGRTVMAAGCVGASAAAIERAFTHATTRKQFGRPLATLEVVERQIAEMEALHFAAAAMVEDAVRVADHQELFLMRSMAAKVLASEVAFELADRAIQLQGGFGFIEESGAPLFLRDARVTRIFEGANDVLATRIGGLELTERGRWSNADLTAARGRVRSLANELVEVWGVRALGQSAELHRIGRLSVLAHASDAVIRHAVRVATPHAHACADHWLALAEERSFAFLSPLAPRARVEAIARSALARIGR